jgi:1,4-dihydroxy-2-naphthoyl-CoA hydrolase
MQCIEVGEDYLRMTMPVDHRTPQPAGLLHGGASVALGETIGGVASMNVVTPGESLVVGIEINANHIRSVRAGHVVATCRPIHIGRSTHVWDIRVETPQGKLVSIIRLTNAIIAAQPADGQLK